MHNTYKTVLEKLKNISRPKRKKIVSVKRSKKEELTKEKLNHFQQILYSNDTAVNRIKKARRYILKN